MIHKIKALHNEGAGLSIRSIARELGISRNTVRKYLRMDEVAIGEQQANRTRRKQLDDYRDYIVTLLGQFPGLSAVKVLRKLKERHPELGVSDRSARRYIKALKETVSLRQKRYYEPVESPPGVQCRVDGGELRGLSVGGEATTVHFVVFVLSYSRLMYVGLSPRPIDTATFIRLHDAAFRYFGGRPEECVYDQTKLVVLHEQYRELDPNPAFAAYATAAGFRIYACEGYDPEGKGKVEAGVKYVKGNALAGEVFDDRDHLEAHVRQWLDGVANVRQHGTTGEAPGCASSATSRTSSVPISPRPPWRPRYPPRPARRTRPACSRGRPTSTRHRWPTRAAGSGCGPRPASWCSLTWRRGRRSPAMSSPATRGRSSATTTTTATRRRGSPIWRPPSVSRSARPPARACAPS